MGSMKNYQIECIERGYGDNPNEVCRDCIGNKDLQNYITQNGYMSTCHYCKRRRKVVTIGSLMNPIMSGIRFSYEHANDCLGYVDGEYVGTTYSSYDLIYSELIYELSIENDEILKDIYETLEDEVWCEADPYADKKYDTEFYSWKSFCELVKKNIRYVFYKSPDVVQDANPSNPVDILETISGYVDKLNLIKYYMPKNRYYGQLFRGRMHSSTKELNNITDFGPPPYQYAASNRMSAEGIPMFYAAFDKETVIEEIYNESDECATIASFDLKRSLLLLNLGRIQDMKLPSIFNETDRGKRSALIFLKKFAEDIARPIDDFPNIEYIPTQIVTEYFRHVFLTKDNKKLDGIVYSSAKNPTGKCVALFMTPEQFKNADVSMVDLDSIEIYKYKKRLASN